MFQIITRGTVPCIEKPKPPFTVENRVALDHCLGQKTRWWNNGVLATWTLSRGAPSRVGCPPEVQGARRHVKLNIGIPKILQIDGTSFWLPSFSSKMMTIMMGYYDLQAFCSQVFPLKWCPTKMMGRLFCRRNFFLPTIMICLFSGWVLYAREKDSTEEQK